MDLTIQNLGIMILAVLVAVAVIILVVSGVGEQSNALNTTTGTVISNLTGLVDKARG